jgi:hypothetical protein
MTNQEYQQMANERSRQADEARRRQSLDEFNRNQQQQRARNEQISRDNYSASLGRRGIAPPILGPAVNPVVYNRALQGYKASQQVHSSFAPSRSAPVYSASSDTASSGISSSSNSGSAAGKFFAFLIVVGGLLLLFGSNHSSNSPSTSSMSESTPVTPSTETTSASQFDSQPTPASSSAYTPPAQENTPQRAEAGFPSVAIPQSTAEPHPQDSQPLSFSSESSTTDTAAPARPIPAWPPAGLTFYASRKGARNGCEEGQLTLGVAGLLFLCPGNESKSVSVAVSQIRDIDDDGIVLYTNEKFHFKTPNTSKEQMHLQFQYWLQKVSPRP